MSKTTPAQRNVTLEIEAKRAKELAGKPFPCPLCGALLPLEMTRKEKPYCTCNACGIQMFFRGKAGIRRLQKLLTAQEPIAEEFRDSSVAVALYNRVSQLRSKREELEQKQGIFFRDRDLDSAIAAINREIRQTQSQLEKAGKRK